MIILGSVFLVFGMFARLISLSLVLILSNFK
ncbi:MAG: hypothetical protein MRERC_2c135 [Mycoplasmataceae bacterium RC_NB112A]|nr:MAG: hypothetical protein MRERC_2c135 [Mycoplasmataceae bacterium RC_NB112A]